MPISFLIVGLLVLVTFSYRQTIRAYPNGGGSYIVAHSNLGTLPGLVAAAALLTDYVLTVAVSVSAGVFNLASAFPALHAITVPLIVVAILLVMGVNLRGIRESGTIFALPTYIFVVSVLLVVVRRRRSHRPRGRPAGDGRRPDRGAASRAISLLLLMRAFADGCSAMTGTEAISNGTPGVQAAGVEERPGDDGRHGRDPRLRLPGDLVPRRRVAARSRRSTESVLSQIGRATFGPGAHLVRPA